jgi:3-hydroxyacyl-CoA dehydrogenase / enoyl-CoA hydratase / 3-hydroxybutyryl-CoA epimerase
MTEAIHSSLGDDGVLLLTLDRQGKSMNTIDQVFLDELSAAIDRITTDPAVRGAVITSGKQAFLAGGDLFEIEASLYRNEGRSAADLVDEIHSLNRVLRRLETCGKPVACALNGLALGGGLELALACHYRVAADDRALQLGLPEVQVSLIPAGGGTTRLPRLLGVQAALPFLLEGKSVDPAGALAAGILHAVVPCEDLLSVARRWVLENPDACAPWDRKGWKIPGGAGALAPSVAQALVVGNAMLQAGTYHNYPAPLAIMSCVYEGTQLPIDKALRLEAKYMARVLTDPVSRNMLRTLFINKSKADKLARRPAGVPRQAYRRIGVLGAGLMGAGIAYAAAQAGLEVVLLDRTAEAAAKGKAWAAKRLDAAIAKGRGTREKADAVLARIRPTAEYDELAGVELVVEAVFEDRAVKAEVTRRAEAVIPAAAVFATNTSTLPITGLAEQSSRPEQFIGLHFFSPVDRMPLVEVVRGKRTSDETLARALDFVALLRRTPIVVNDSRGFFTSRFFGAIVNEGVAMVGEGVNPALIENVARIAGLPIGPLAVSDEVGLDLAVSVARQTARDVPDYRPGASLPVIERLVEQCGRHGRKNGKGFYEYAADGTKRLWPGLADLFPRAAVQPDAATLRRRLLYAALVDAARCMAEGVITDPGEADVGSILGVGFPPYLGGPFSMMDTVGLPRLLGECDALAEAHGERFVMPQLVRDMARAGRTFYGPGTRP